MYTLSASIKSKLSKFKPEVFTPAVLNKNFFLSKEKEYCTSRLRSSDSTKKEPSFNVLTTLENPSFPETLTEAPPIGELSLLLVRFPAIRYFNGILYKVQISSPPTPPERLETK